MSGGGITRGVSPAPTPSPGIGDATERLVRFCWENGNSCFEITNSTSVVAIVILAGIVLLTVVVWRFGKPLAARMTIATAAAQQAAADAAAAKTAAELGALRASEATYAITNGHEKEFRVDMDDKHTEALETFRVELSGAMHPILVALTDVGTNQDSIRTEIADLRIDVRDNRRENAEVARRLTQHIERHPSDSTAS